MLWRIGIVGPMTNNSKSEELLAAAVPYTSWCLRSIKSRGLFKRSVASS